LLSKHTLAESVNKTYLGKIGILKSEL
jgi:hypothetical protein